MCLSLTEKQIWWFILILFSFYMCVFSCLLVSLPHSTMVCDLGFCRCLVKQLNYVNGYSQKDHKLVFKTYDRLMQVKNIGECSKREHSAILLTFIKLSFVIKIFILSIFDLCFTQVLLYSLVFGDSIVTRYPSSITICLVVNHRL